jgi:hypothetical protein
MGAERLVAMCLERKEDVSALIVPIMRNVDVSSAGFCTKFFVFK